MVFNFIVLSQKRSYHRSQSLGYKNGYALAKRPEVGIGGEPLEVNQLSLAELEELNNKRPTLTYGQAKQAPPEDFIPAHVAFDKKVGIHGYGTSKNLRNFFSLDLQNSINC